MMIIPLIDTNPVLGPVQSDGKQQIGLYDSKTGGKRYISTTKEKVDDFINNKNAQQKEDTKLTGKLTAGAALIGGIAGKVGLKSFGKFGIAIGAIYAAAAGFAAGVIKSISNEDKLTQQFIQENK